MLVVLYVLGAALAFIAGLAADQGEWGATVFCGLTAIGIWLLMVCLRIGA